MERTPICVVLPRLVFHFWPFNLQIGSSLPPPDHPMLFVIPSFPPSKTPPGFNSSFPSLRIFYGNKAFTFPLTHHPKYDNKKRPATLPVDVTYNRLSPLLLSMKKDFAYASSRFTNVARSICTSELPPFFSLIGLT